MPASILIVDDESTYRFFLERTLRDQGYDILAAGSVADAVQLVYSRHIDCALLDQNLPDGPGNDVLRAIKQVDTDLPVIVLTGHGSLDSVKTALRSGVYDYLVKPPDLCELKHVVKQALENVDLKREIKRLRNVQLKEANDLVMGRSPAMREIIRLAQRVANTTTSVLIQGESGTGKEVIAKLIHRHSPRASHAFMAINCAAIPEHLLESELFGHEAGAFTGARRQKKGLIETAHQGTLFLDEMGAMRLDMQAKLLRVLETREVRRLGGSQDIKVDVRVIAATNRDLRAAIAEGEFREDLFWRLGVVEIHLPPLRERAEDLELYIAKFVSEFARQFGRDIRGVSPAALAALRSHRWPGNIRELRNVMERAALLCEDHEILDEHLPTEIMKASRRPDMADLHEGAQLPPNGLDMKRVLGEIEIDLIQQALERAGGNQTQAAQLLGITRDELRYRLKKVKHATD